MAKATKKLNSKVFAKFMQDIDNFPDNYFDGYFIDTRPKSKDDLSNILQPIYGKRKYSVLSFQYDIYDECFYVELKWYNDSIDSGKFSVSFTDFKQYFVKG